MGRQPKQGLDYFPCDVDWMDDPKLRRPRQTFGYLSAAVYQALLCILYKDKGYYIDYAPGNPREDVLWQVYHKIDGKYTITFETLANVIDCFAACELFSGELYKAGIITSKRAQKVYYTATVDRKYVDINFDIWLLSEQDMKKLSSKSVILQSFISRPINPVNRSVNEENQPKSTQSREQKSREQDSTEKHSIAENSRERADALTADLERIIGTEIDGNFRLDIARLMDAGMQEAVFLEAARQTEDRKPRKPAAYLRTILQGFEREGILTSADIDATQGKDAPRNAACQGDATASKYLEQEWLDRIRKHRAEHQEELAE